MADEEKRITYVIRVISEGGEGEGEQGEASGKGDSAGGNKKKKKKRTFDDYSAYEKYKYITQLAPVGYAMKMASTVVSNEINRVELRTGNAVLQQKIEFAKSNVMRAGALALSVASGNPLLMVGAVVSTVDQIADIQRRQTSINLERQLESVGIGMANIRAGAYGSRGGRSDI